MTRRGLNRGVLVVMALLVTAAAHAQQLPPGKWWRRPEVVKKLVLTAEQQERLDGIFRDAADELIDARADADKGAISLRAELDRPTLDKQRIRAVATKLNEARAKLFERELMMLVDMRGVLTAPQWERMRGVLDQMDERRGDRRGPPGGGPPGGGPPGGDLGGPPPHP